MRKDHWDREANGERIVRSYNKSRQRHNKLTEEAEYFGPLKESRQSNGTHY